MLEHVAILDPDLDRRPELAAELAAAGFEIAGPDDGWSASSGSGAGVVVVAAGNRLLDEFVELRARIGEHIAVVVAVDAAVATDRLDEVTAVGVDALVVGMDLDEIVEATTRVGNGAGYISAVAMRPVLEEIHRLRARDQERNLELEELVRRLHDLSISDGLTGLKSHDYFFDRLDDELGRALRHRRQLSVLLCGIDGLDATIESRGRRVADKMLQASAGAIDATLRAGDVVARVSGEGLAVLLPETDAVGATLVADRIRQQVAGLVIPDVGRVTVSIGLASTPEHAVDRDGLLDAAERALYLARRDGRNTTRSAGAGAGMVMAFDSTLRRGSGDQVVELLVRVLRLRDPALAEHATRTAEIAVSLGAQMGLGTDRLDRLRIASLLQDVGKIGVPDSILHKRGGLTAEEWAVIQDHPKRGFELIGGLVDPEAAETVLNNHERWDGQGYPRAIHGEQIPILARVLLVADAFAAMTSDRSFRPTMTSGEALVELRRNAGSQFDPTVVAAMTAVARRGEPEDLRSVAGGR